MKNTFLIIVSLAFAFITSCSTTGYKMTNHTDSNGLKYESVTNDPYHARIYMLNNGLTVYLSVNKDEPRIQSFIAVKAGSTYDPADNTGLAHYLEHMMFKGTPKLGTINWEAEKPYIKQISDLYEAHKAATDPAEKKAIYHQIDSISQIASQYVAPNEYDRLLTSIGGNGINAYTTNERTVFVDNIPSNELDKWLQIESERFYNLVLRVFHTELETVYEEFNMGQDRDGTKAYKALMSELFPNHPYGQQTTIGKAEHLKNPSMENIMKYWGTYYVPNNMAICLSGDMEPDSTIQMINKYFGSVPEKDVPVKDLPAEKPITHVSDTTVLGPQPEFLYMGFRFKGVGSEDQKYVTLIDYMLSNAKAGLIDIDLNQTQKVLRAGCGPNFMKDYGYHIFFGNPRQGQSLEEVKDLMLGEIDKIKKGEFDDWLIEASINNMKLDEIRGQESNQRAHNFAVTFANNESWADYLRFYDELSKITKQQIMQFAQTHYTDSDYVVVYKRKGVDPNVVKVEKPDIHPVDLKRENESEFYKTITAEKENKIQPVFIDFKNTISNEPLAENVNFSYIKNPTNQLFSLYYIIDMGKDNDKKLPLAVEYLPFLGTDKYTAAELQQEFFKYGLSFGVSTGDDRSYVYVNGLEDNAEKGMELLEQLLSNVKPDTAAYRKYLEGIAKKRSDKKLDKSEILYRAMMSYAKYGKVSGYTDILLQADMEQIKPEELTGIIKGITSYQHQVFYYGQKTQTEVEQLLKKYHHLPAELKPVPAKTDYPELALDKPMVYFVDYDMVQDQLIILSKDEKLNVGLIPNANLFNEFYGEGLSSIVFQEIRESKALAYSAYSYFSTPKTMDKSHYNYSFVATQADKLKAAVDAMKAILDQIPESGSQFENSKGSIMKKIESERIIKDDIFWTYLSAKDRGIDYDIRKDVYDYVQHATMDDFKKFFDQHISNKQDVYLVIGKKDQLDMKMLKQLGPVNELSLEDIFNY